MSTTAKACALREVSKTCRGAKLRDGRITRPLCVPLRELRLRRRVRPRQNSERLQSLKARAREALEYYDNEIEFQRYEIKALLGSLLRIKLRGNKYLFDHHLKKKITLVW